MNLIDRHAPDWIEALLASDLLKPQTAGVTCYALVDCAFSPACYQQIKTHVDTSRWRSLYRDTPSAVEDVIAHSPILLEVQGIAEPQLRRILALTDGLPMLSFIGSAESLDDLCRRLSPWCVIDAEGQHYVLRFPDTRRLPDVLSALSKEQVVQFCGSGTRWQYRARDASWQTFSLAPALGSNAPPCLQPALNGAQCALLIAASEPDEVTANLLHLNPRYADHRLPSSLHALAVQALRAADAMRIDSQAQRMDLCEQFWRNPDLSKTPAGDLESLRALLS